MTTPKKKRNPKGAGRRPLSKNGKKLARLTTTIGAEERDALFREAEKLDISGINASFLLRRILAGHFSTPFEERLKLYFPGSKKDA